MLFKATTRRTILMAAALLSLSACYKPPYNNFQPYNSTVKTASEGAVVGTAAGALAGNTLVGTAIGGGLGTLYGVHKNSRRQVIKDINNASMQLVDYGDTMTLIVPTDKYYIFDSARLNPVCYKGLALIAKLMRFYPCTPVYVAGFTDNVGSRKHKTKLSQAQAETMLTFLWANGVHAKRLNAEGYGENHDIGQNAIIHGSAFNRRVEIQWLKHCPPQQEPVALTK
jgi:outer membrane protein OmpA-like peptidoglycan-associated protein